MAGLASLTSIRGSAPSNVWAVGAKGTVVHYDGKAWSPVQVNLDPNTELMDTWTSGPNDVWIVGQKPAATTSGHAGVAHHFDGQTWTSNVPPALYRVQRLWGERSERPLGRRPQ